MKLPVIKASHTLSYTQYHIIRHVIIIIILYIFYNFSFYTTYWQCQNQITFKSYIAPYGRSWRVEYGQQADLENSLSINKIFPSQACSTHFVPQWYRHILRQTCSGVQFSTKKAVGSLPLVASL